MKRKALLILPMLIIFFACGNHQNKKTNDNKYAAYNENYDDDSEDDEDEDEPEEPSIDEDDDSDYAIEKEASSGSGKSNSSHPKLFGKSRLKTHEFKDAHTGLTANSTKYPADWQVISKPSYTIDQKLPMFLIQIQGPHHLKTFNTPLTVYVSYRNPQTYRVMAQNGVPPNMQRPIVSNQQILETEVKSRMEKSGFHYSENIHLPKTENYLKQKFREGGSNVNSEITCDVWENNQGQKAMTMITKGFVEQPLSFIDVMTLWLYSVDYTFVDAAQFDETINQMENALINIRENAEWQQYVQQLTQQRMVVAQQQYEQNRRTKEAAFNAHQEKMRGIWAAEDANHAAFMNRSFGAGSSNSQQQVVNMINEQETVYNPLTGKNYQVDAGSTEYWMDSSGNYIRNNDLFYTPNGDINLNNRDWIKVNNAF